MNGGHSVIGFFAEVDLLEDAVKGARAAGYERLQVISPVPLTRLDVAIENKRSPVRFFTLAGGLIGFGVGWALTTGSAAHYPIIVGGKPLMSLTPFGVIAYVCTILFGTLFTVGGMLFNARLPRIQVGRGYDARLTGNRFGLQVICSSEQCAGAGDLLREFGAEEVKHVEV
jgi:hypothetical protein